LAVHRDLKTGRKVSLLQSHDHFSDGFIVRDDLFWF
jgi:hypothetical protein